MLDRLASLRHWLQRRWLYSALPIFAAVTIVAAQPQLVRAADWVQILIQGAQIVQLSNISDSQEAALGAQTNQSIVSKVKLYSNPAVTSYVERIGQKLARTSARPNIKYTFQVVDDDGINAFATMGGYVYINTGTIKSADNEAQLASVIGHEIGHITGRHSIKQLKQAAITQGIGTIVGVDRDQIVQIAVNLALTLPNSREDEYDADNRGLKNIISSGYAPSAMPEFMKKLVSGNSAPSFLSSHPAASERVVRLQKSIPAAYRNTTEGLNQTSYKQNVSNFFSQSNIAPARSSSGF